MPNHFRLAGKSFGGNAAIARQLLNLLLTAGRGAKPNAFS
jgi:hypothetical protein